MLDGDRWYTYADIVEATGLPVSEYTLRHAWGAKSRNGKYWWPAVLRVIEDMAYTPPRRMDDEKRTDQDDRQVGGNAPEQKPGSVRVEGEPTPVAEVLPIKDRPREMETQLREFREWQTNREKVFG